MRRRTPDRAELLEVAGYLCAAATVAAAAGVGPLAALLVDRAAEVLDVDVRAGHAYGRGRFDEIGVLKRYGDV
jgi:hypothetical protein